MIARIWFGRTRAEDDEAYLGYIEGDPMRELRATPGNQGVMVLRRKDGDETEFGVLSLWDSIEDVKAFAGEDVDVARYFPEDDRFLLELPPRLKHYEGGHRALSNASGPGSTGGYSDRRGQRVGGRCSPAP